MLRLTLRDPWLMLDFGQRHQILGWPVFGPSCGSATRLAWLQVEDRDLPPDLQPDNYFRNRARTDHVEAEIGLMTAADIRRHAVEKSVDAAMEVTVIATAGLTNGESVEPARGPVAADQEWHAGTINIVTHVTAPLTQAAMIEALSIVAEARTAAVLSLGISLVDGRRLTGTGTDCIIVASPPGSHPLAHCGLHTTLGRLIGTTVYRAVRTACSA